MAATTCLLVTLLYWFPPAGPPRPAARAPPRHPALTSNTARACWQLFRAQPKHFLPGR